jgi:hypothetical protein
LLNLGDIKYLRSSWLNLIRPIDKPDVSIRLRLNLKYSNKLIKRVKFIIKNNGYIRRIEKVEVFLSLRKKESVL